MIRDKEARSASLDNDYGTTRGPHAADSHEVALYDQDGVELTDVSAPGYVRAVLMPADWAPAVDGSKTALATFAAPTDEWPTVTDWALIGDDGLVWDTAALVVPLDVTSASDDGPQIAVTVNYTNL